MIRIPINRIENTNINLSEISCCQCKFLIIQTFVHCTKCNINFCEECYLKIMEEKKSCIKCGAEKDLMKEEASNLDMEQLKVRCINFIHGCNLVFSYNNLIDLNKHEVKCDYKMIKCGICKTAEFIQKNSKQHEEVCPKAIISCLNCKNLFERQNLEKHNKIECFYILSSCKYCEKEIPLISLKEHLIGCTPIRVKCKNCGFNKLRNHDCILGLLNKIYQFYMKNDIWTKAQKEDQEDIIETLEKIKSQVESLKSDCFQNANMNTIDIKNTIANLVTTIIKIYEEQGKRNIDDSFKIFKTYEDLQNNLNNSDLKIQVFLKDLIVNLNLVFKSLAENKQEIKTIIANMITTEISSKLNNLDEEVKESRTFINDIPSIFKNEISQIIFSEVSLKLNNINKEVNENKNLIVNISKDLKADIIQKITSEIYSKYNNLDNEIKESRDSIIGISSTLKNEFDIIKNLIQNQSIIAENKFQDVNISNETLNKEIINLNQNLSNELINMKYEFESLKKEFENQSKKFYNEMGKSEEHFTKIQNGIQEINTESNYIKKKLNDEGAKKTEEELIRIENGIVEANNQTKNIKEVAEYISSSITTLSHQYLENLKLKIEEINKNCQKNFEEILIMNFLTLDRMSMNPIDLEEVINKKKFENNKNLNSISSIMLNNNDNFVIKKIRTLGEEIILNFVGSKIETNKNSELSIIENELMPKVTSILKDICSLSSIASKNLENMSFTSIKYSFINSLNNWIKEFASNYIFNEEIYNTKEQLKRNQYLYYVEFEKNSQKLFLHLKNLKSLPADIIKQELYNYEENIYYYDGVLHKCKYFCCGGKLKKEYLNICSIFNLENLILDNSIKLNEQKSDVSLVSTTNYIWCIGGLLQGNKSTKTCEFFDDINNLWKIGPTLNNPSYEISSFFFEPEEIYLFGGGNTSKFEKLNINSLSNHWEITKIDYIIPRNYGCVFQINNFELLIFGGLCQSGEFFIFNTKHSSIIPLSKKFSKNIRFNTTRAIYFDHSIQLVCKDNNNVLQINPNSLDCKETPLNF